MLYVEAAFVYFFHSYADVIMTLFKHFVCCNSLLLIMTINVWHSIETRTLMHPLTSGVHDSKQALCTKCRHFKHMLEINPRRQTNSIYRN